ncbi:HIT family protein [Streptomyces sp. NBC_01190]|uniref:HIT family protein n=1 Tax=Streptomyces sp. NBC_01190 TaxID=2903767 RepID=UPI003864D3F4|nr:HIT domain-containing protein [Streptomyces sp. NBC_01190]
MGISTKHHEVPDDESPYGSRSAPPDCPFCSIVRGDAPAAVLREWPDALAILPRDGGVTAGHVLVLPKAHVADVATDPAVSAITMRRAAELAAEGGDCNVITSRGPAATQTVRHLHIHLVPRTHGDGVLLPWTPSPRP